MSRIYELTDAAMRGSGCEGESEAVVNAIRTYGEEVRKKAAQECRDLMAYDEDDPGESCAKAIEKMDLP